MFKDAIESVGRSFLDEAARSPQLLADMAMMEYYMAESYSGRVFIELLQNADDAESRNVSVKISDDAIIFANDGRPFNEADLSAISRSGASNKERGKSIGYRGIGFKSATAISENILIYSSGAYFTFSKSLCAKALGMQKSEVPTVRIPLPVTNVPPSIDRSVRKHIDRGFTTIFVLQQPKVDLFNMS